MLAITQQMYLKISKHYMTIKDNNWNSNIEVLAI